MLVAPSPLHRSAKSVVHASQEEGQIPLPALINQALSFLQSGNVNGARLTLARAPASARDDAFACKAFSLIYLSANDYDQAIAWFDNALRLNGKNAEALSGKGTALQGAGRLAEAIASFDRALALTVADPETWYNRGVALDALGDIEAALQSYDTALVHRPVYARALARRSAALAKLGRFEEALATANTLIAVATENRADAWCLRGNMLQELGRYSDAIAAYNQTLGIDPNYVAALINRATANAEIGKLDDALRDLDIVLRVASDPADALISRANVLQNLGRNAAALEDYKSAFALRPLITHAAVTKEPEFRALFIFAPVSGNTPIHDMIGFSNFESHLLMLLPGVVYDADFLRTKTDVVVNLVSDADRSAEALADATRLTQHLAKPVINAPAKILSTERDHVSRLLGDTTGCVVPQTSRYVRDELLAMLRTGAFNMPFPLIARIAGTHGGDDMERIDGLAELEAFVRSHEATDYYLSEFIDYRSADGYFRKYRFIFVGEKILPYHLAIHDQWKVHHASTDMANHLWMQGEEKVFLELPQIVFPPATFEALRAIRSTLDLDYFGIDCALTHDQKVVVFEVNASMLVHLRNEQFPYKNPAVRRIKAAFAELLRDKAMSQRPA
jgi:tetratricopeptide (TPR) repeat protein